jgi:polyribonucleotide 5'-hydroxyl-kinase
MKTYANLALLFEQMRLRAFQNARNSPEPAGTPQLPDGIPRGPPRILVVGPESSGKTTATKLLVNYATRSEANWEPMLVNLDTSDVSRDSCLSSATPDFKLCQGGYTVPGTISAAPVDSPIMTFSAANPLGLTASSAPTTLGSSALNPLVYWFGHLELRRKVMLMERLIRNLGDNVLERGRLDDKCCLQSISCRFEAQPS